MGWSSGGDIADRVWNITQKHLRSKTRAQVAYDLIRLFEGYDCDVMQETALWAEAFDRCSCLDNEEECHCPTTHGCPNCEGLGWVLKKNII